MPYATLSDLVARYGEQELLELTDRELIGQMNSPVVQAALDAADAAIDGYLAARYAVPVTPPPLLLRTLAEDLAWHRLHGKAEVASVRQAAEAALRVLRDLATGTAALPGAAPAAPAANPALGSSEPRWSAPARRLGPCQLGDYLGDDWKR